MFVHFVTHTLSLPISCRVYDSNLVNALHMTNHMRDLQFIYICMKVATIMYKNRRQSSTQKTRTIQTVTVKKNILKVTDSRWRIENFAASRLVVFINSQSQTCKSFPPWYIPAFTSGCVSKFTNR